MPATARTRQLKADSDLSTYRFDKPSVIDVEPTVPPTEAHVTKMPLPRIPRTRDEVSVSTLSGSQVKDNTLIPPPSLIDGPSSESYSKSTESLQSFMVDFKPWDVFRLLPIHVNSYERIFWLNIALQALKLGAYATVFVLILGLAVLAKGTLLLMTSGISKAGRNYSGCLYSGQLSEPSESHATYHFQNKHVLQWIWLVFLSLCVPEIFCLIRCLHRIWFRSVKKPTAMQFLVAVVMESFYAIGMGLLAFKVLPDMDVVRGAMLCQCVCFLPSLLLLLSRKRCKLSILFVLFDLFAIAAQSSGLWAWPLLPTVSRTDLWLIPISLFLVSFGWWENFVHHTAIFPCIRNLAHMSHQMKQVHSKIYVTVSPFKCLIYFCCLISLASRGIPLNEILSLSPLKPQSMLISIWQPNITPKIRPTTFTATIPTPPSTRTPPPTVIDALDYLTTLATVTKAQLPLPREKRSAANSFELTRLIYTDPLVAIWIFVVHCLSAFLCYQCGKFACKTMMQRFSFALPLNLATPVIIAIFMGICSSKTSDECFLDNIMPPGVFWNCSDQHIHKEFFNSPFTWIWFIWYLSQVWITIHIWMPECERLASTDRLFVLPWYSGAIIDQSLSLNRRRDDKLKIKTEDLELEAEDNAASNIYETVCSVYSVGKVSTKPESLKAYDNHLSDAITKIYACATMWHETSQEMICMLKSIFRLDEDQCARRNVQKYLKVVDPDYYEFEAHIMFDDAYELNEYAEPVVNRFVRQFINVIDIAASSVHETVMRVQAPKKYTTPYGGQLVWTLPGKNKLTVHLKDKSKIRVRKRWSQVMYMYYLLGYRLMEKIEDSKRKEIIAENTYILTLDGDVDFEPASVHLLVDLMKKNRRLGAACGRMHPRGTGLMVWYQTFEYAIGHWFQKATEHMIGCVLCAPGCFSLFRSAALMDDNVLRKYATKAELAKDYVQYDQGEDRWLCTLLLQRGYKVEYCAASDALTFAPEGFNEFFNQRRRWIPSTVANIVDLLVDYRNVVRVNDSISIWYIAYQFAMLISNILGPGTIFLMVIGAVNISFNVSTSLSFLTVVLPVLFFAIVCLTCKSETQLLVGQIVGALFALLMMAVIVGTSVQIMKDGIYSPNAVFLLAIIISFFIAACLHPLEFFCIVPGIIYFLAIPCMYMLLIIYSICNLHIVMWGTREVKSSDDPNQKRKDGRSTNLMGPKISDDDDVISLKVDGVYTVGCGSLCRFLCCLQPSAVGNSPQMNNVLKKLELIEKKLENMDRRVSIGSNRRSLHETKSWENRPMLFEEIIDDDFDTPGTENVESRDKLENRNAWQHDKVLKHATIGYIDSEEEKFWKDLIDKYLSPLNLDRKHQEQVANDLKELRNRVSFGFFMINTLFILIVLLLQLKKDCLFVEWPIGPLVNHTIIPCNSDAVESVWVMTRLQLEPIGLVFLVFFMTLLLLQFLAMLMHRFTTLAHVIASTKLWCFRKPEKNLSEDEMVMMNAVEIAKELQAIRGIDEESTASTNDEALPISHRRVVQKLESSRRSMMKRRTETLDAAFRKRFFALSSNNANLEPDSPGFGPKHTRLTLKRSMVKAIEQRRNSVFGTLDRSNIKKYKIEKENVSSSTGGIYRFGAESNKDGTSQRKRGSSSTDDEETSLRQMNAEETGPNLWRAGKDNIMRSNIIATSKTQLRKMASQHVRSEGEAKLLQRSPDSSISSGSSKRNESHL